MRIHAISDVHVDFAPNARWISNLSLDDYRDDVLILAGDVADELPLLAGCFQQLVKRFRTVLYVPGNHDLWVHRGGGRQTSFQKLEQVRALAADCGVSLGPYRAGPVSVVPLLGWYDYSFGPPGDDLREIWMDYRACRWPEGFDAPTVARHLTLRNAEALRTRNETIVSFSHFMPRIDLMPSTIPARHRILYPVLGSSLIEEQIRRLGSRIHVYGHSHVNRRVRVDGIQYVNNALGYPHETRITRRQLACVLEC